MELLRTSGGRVFCLIARLSPGLGLALAFWVVHVWVFSGSPSGSECSVLCFRHGCDVCATGPPLLLGWRASLYRPGQRKTNRMGERYSLWGRSGFPGPLRATHRRRCVPFLFATGCSVKVGSSISVSFWLGCLGTGVLALGHETVCFVSLWPVALVLSLRVFFVKNLLSSWFLGVGVALALTLARLLLRDFGPLVPRPLLPGLWWRCWSWVARSCSPGHITASVLVPGP